MGLKLNTASSGSVTIEPTNTASNYTLTVPAQTGTVVATDASGNVGIGTSTPLEKLTVLGNGRISDSIIDVGSIEVGIYGSGDRVSYVDFHSSGTPTALDLSARIIRGIGVNGSFSIVNSGSGNIIFDNNNAERMRITSNGILLVGYTAVGNNIPGIVGAVGYNTKAGQAAGLSGNMFNINWTGSPQLWIDTTNVGTIQLSSDYRIKRNIETQTAPALERVMALRPVTYQMADYGTLFKASDEIKEGFIAHEVQDVIPSGAEGVKDDPDQIQSLRVDAILAVAVKAIQEQQAIITEQSLALQDLKARVEALENK